MAHGSKSSADSGVRRSALRFDPLEVRLRLREFNDERVPRSGGRVVPRLFFARRFHSKVSEWSYADRDVVLTKGAEMGRFLLGSTIVMLFGQGAIAFNADWAPERTVRLGEMMGNSPG